MYNYLPLGVYHQLRINLANERSISPREVVCPKCKADPYFVCKSYVTCEDVAYAINRCLNHVIEGGLNSERWYYAMKHLYTIQPVDARTIQEYNAEMARIADSLPFKQAMEFIKNGYKLSKKEGK